MASITHMSIEGTSLAFPILLLLPLFFLLLRRKFSEAPTLPPGPNPWPIIGNISHLGNKLHIALAQLAQAHGPLLSLRLGTQLVVVGSSKAAATEILRTHDRQLCGRHVPYVSFAKDPKRNTEAVGWTFELTEQWKYLRTLIKSELITPKITNSQSIIREKKVGEMIEFLGSKEGEMVEVREVMFVYSFNTLGNIYFSRDFLDFEGEEGKRMSGFIREMMELWATPNISDMYPILSGLDLQGLSKKGSECIRNMCGMWESVVRERRKNRCDDERRNRDFLDVLLDNGFSDDQINSSFVEIFAAGSDGSVTTVEWALAELLKNPEAMNKLREELTREISDSFVRESHIPNLPYLHACVKETFRLHPTAPLLLPRRATETCQVMNYTIPKDTKVLINVWAIARDPTIWEDPLSFKPERFLNCDMDFKGNHFELLPFGGGRRMCPGLPMASRQIHLALANLIHHFEWSLPYNMLPHQLDMNERFGLTLQMEQPLVLLPKQRK